MSIKNTVDFTNTWVTGTPLQPDSIVFVCGDKDIVKRSGAFECGYFLGIGSITGILRMVSSIRALANEIFFDTKYLFGSEPISRSRRFYIIGQNFVRGLIEALPGTGIPLFIKDVILETERQAEACKQLKENDVGIIVNGELVVQMPSEKLFAAVKKQNPTLEKEEEILEVFSNWMLLAAHEKEYQEQQMSVARRLQLIAVRERSRV